MGTQARGLGPQAAAVVLAGGITWGAFEAGALQVLAERRIPVRRIVAASVGALNGAAFAAGVRARREVAATRELVEVWQGRGGIASALHPSLQGILGLRGFSDQAKLLALLRDCVRPTAISDPAPIDLLMVVTVLRGVESAIGGEPAVRYTKLLRYGGEFLDRPELLEEVFRGATASAALPLLFVPVEVPELGPCVDGGLLDSLPIRYAREAADGSRPDAVIMIAPSPAHLPKDHQTYRGLKLLSRLLEMVFSERNYDSLRRSFAENEACAMQARLVRSRSRKVGRGVLRCTGSESRRAVRIVSIRPTEQLPGNQFSGFTDPAARRRYIELGVERASQVLDQVGWR